MKMLASSEARRLDSSSRVLAAHAAQAAQDTRGQARRGPGGRANRRQRQPRRPLPPRLYPIETNDYKKLVLELPLHATVKDFNKSLTAKMKDEPGCTALSLEEREVWVPVKATGKYQKLPRNNNQRIRNFGPYREGVVRDSGVPTAYVLFKEGHGKLPPRDTLEGLTLDQLCDDDCIPRILPPLEIQTEEIPRVAEHPNANGMSSEGQVGSPVGSPPLRAENGEHSQLQPGRLTPIEGQTPNEGQAPIEGRNAPESSDSEKRPERPEERGQADGPTTPSQSSSEVSEATGEIRQPPELPALPRPAARKPGASWRCAECQTESKFYHAECILCGTPKPTVAQAKSESDDSELCAGPKSDDSELCASPEASMEPVPPPPPGPPPPAVRAAPLAQPAEDRKSASGTDPDNSDEEMTQEQEAALRQIEYYFSAKNLKSDRFLSRMIAKNVEGWVDFEVLQSFSKMKKLGLSNAELAHVLRQSKEEIEVSPEGDRVRVKRASDQPGSSSPKGSSKSYQQLYLKERGSANKLRQRLQHKEREVQRVYSENNQLYERFKVLQEEHARLQQRLRNQETYGSRGQEPRSRGQESRGGSIDHQGRYIPPRRNRPDQYGDRRRAHGDEFDRRGYTNRNRMQGSSTDRTETYDRERARRGGRRGGSQRRGHAYGRTTQMSRRPPATRSSERDDVMPYVPNDL